jgi:hypothetical protein
MSRFWQNVLVGLALLSLAALIAALLLPARYGAYEYHAPRREPVGRE